MNIRGRLGNQQGSIIAMVAIAMIAFVAVLAIVIDLGHLHSVRQELRNAAEAGALAGARALFPMPGDPSTKIYPDCTRGLQAARNAAALNKTDIDQNVIVLAADAKLIRWDWQLNQISPPVPSCNLESATGVNGIRVTTRRDSSVPAGSVFLTFGKIFETILGRDTMDVEVSATAAAGFASSIFSSLCINKEYYDSIQGQPGDILISPDKADNGAWCAPSPYNPTASNLANWIAGTPPSPGAEIGDIVNFVNGVFGSVYHALQVALTNNSQTYGNVTGWLVLFPVVETLKYTAAGPVVDLKPVIITSIVATGNPKGINFRLYDGPNPLPGTNPGGAQSPLYTLPKLVE